MELFCPWEAPQFLFLSSSTPAYLLYSHGIAIVFALLFGFLLIYKKRNLLSNIFFTITLLFSIWTFSDLVQWASNNPAMTLFFWSLNIVLEFLVYSGAVYLSYVFIRKKDLRIRYKALLFAAIAPILVMLPGRNLLPSVDVSTCTVTESTLVIVYSYAFQVLIILGLIFLTSWLLKGKDTKTKKESWIFIGGIIVFLLAFSSGNIIGSLTENWQLAQYGLFGMPIFIGVLMYLIVRYQSFQTKMIAAQLLVITLGILVFSILFARTVDRMRIIASVTFIIVCFVGYALVRSVKREVKQREQLEVLSAELEQSNEKLKGLDKLKTEFLSLASHQLRSPLTAIKGYASMLSEGSFGKLEEKQDEAARRIYSSAQGLVSIVEDLLNVSKIEQGGMKYEMMPTDLAKVITDLYNEMKIPAQNKKLEFLLDIPADQSFMATVDPLKLKQSFLNLTDNSIKYTEQGFVKLSLAHEGKNIVFAVTDSGVGISPETKAKLFEKFSRGEGGKLNTGGSGLGLYLAREIARAHKGDIEILSEGLGKGSSFRVVLPQ